MSGEGEREYKFILLGLVLFFFLFFGPLVILFDYLGIPFDNERTDSLNITGFFVAFSSILLALRALHLIYLKKNEGDWTPAGKTRWRYCLVGSVAVTFLSIIIEALHLSELPKLLLELVSMTVVALYFGGKYYEQYIYKAAKDEKKKESYRNRP